MSDTTIYKKIIEYLLDFIVTNGNMPGYKLPSERNLAEKFKASRRPIRFAYAKLIESGVAEKVHGKGYFVKNPVKVKKINIPKQVPKNIIFITPAINSLLLRQIITGMKKFCEEHHLELSIKICDQNIEKENQYIRNVPASKANGLILYPVDNEYYNNELLKLSMSKFPITIIDRQYKGLKFSFIAMDNYNAMVDAVKFLYSKKHKNIVYITPPASLATSIEERINGYNHGLFKYYNMAKSENLLKIKPDDLPAQKKALGDYLKKYPDTEVIIVTGVQATAALQAAMELNIPVPEKLKLMIIDCELSEVEIIAVKPYIVEVSGYDMGYKAAAALYNQMYGDLRIITEKLPVEIIDSSDKIQ